MDASNNFANTDFPQFFPIPSKAKNPISFKESTPYPIPYTLNQPYTLYPSGREQEKWGKIEFAKKLPGPWWICDVQVVCMASTGKITYPWKVSITITGEDWFRHRSLELYHRLMDAVVLFIIYWSWMAPKCAMSTNALRAHVLTVSWIELMSLTNIIPDIIPDIRSEI